MKEYVSTIGGRHLYSSDIKNLQELALSMQEMLKSTGVNFVINGCECHNYSSNLGTATYEEGYVFIDGKIRHVERADVSNVVNLKIVAKERKGNNIPYKDGTFHEQYVEYYAEYVNADTVDAPYIACYNTSRPATFPRISDAFQKFFLNVAGYVAEQTVYGSLNVNGNLKGSTLISDGSLKLNNEQLKVYVEDNGICFELKDTIAIKFGNQVIYYKEKATGDWLKLLSIGNYSAFGMGQTVMLDTLIAKTVSNGSAIEYVPVGGIINFAGSVDKIPNDYMLCDGRELEMNIYRSLYNQIGDRFNNSYNYQGIKYDNPQDGCFRLPDLRGRFVVGYNPKQTDYGNIGNVGGEKAHQLTVAELAQHKHYIDAYREKETLALFDGGASTAGAKRFYGDTGVWDDDSSTSNDDDDWGNNWDLTKPQKRPCVQIEYPTQETGMGQPHENRPPFYVLSYIIRVK